MLSPLIALATLVFCAPGYPGAPEDAQPLLDTFVQTVTAAAHWPAGSLDAVYDPTEAGGMQKLSGSGAALALVPYPFYFAHARELRLTPELQADVEGVGTEEHWTLVVPRGKVPSPAAMSNYTLASVAGYAPEFVRRLALPDWPLPPGVHIVASEQVLTMLRRSASGEPLAVLLDAQQTTALASLPFATQLQQAARSPALPVAVLARVAERLPPERVRSLRAALLALPHTPAGADALSGLRLKGFVPVHLPAGAP